MIEKIKGMHKKVYYKGEPFWLHEVPGFGFNLSPLDHYTESGQLLVSLDDISYAVVYYNGKIMRFGQQIGVMSDLKDSND